MNQSTFSVIILAAGQGTRMRSDTHKVLHPIAGKPMLMHLLDTVEALGGARRVVVVGKGREQIEKALQGHDVATAVQAEQKGTGHAVAMAADALSGFDGAVVVLFGDVPFVQADSLGAEIDPPDPAHNAGRAVRGGQPNARKGRRRRHPRERQRRTAGRQDRQRRARGAAFRG